MPRNAQRPKQQTFTPAELAEKASQPDAVLLSIVSPVAPANGEDIIDAEVIEDEQPATSTDLTVRRSPKELAQARLRTAVEYLQGPVRDGEIGEWNPRTTIAGRTSAAATAGMCDSWGASRDGSPAPRWAVGRLARQAKLAAQDGRRPELVVKSAMGLPLIARAFEDAWLDTYGEPPLQKDVATVTFEAFDLLTQGFGWTRILEAVALAAAEGHVFVQRAYRDLTTAGARRTHSRPGGQSDTRSFLERAAAEQARRDAMNGMNGAAA